jgi:Lrp/AsnC family transcriptional regulator, leucine-responsive regulatory protein
MLKIDLKDRKILYQLDLNCRQSNTQIGKKVGLKKDVVSYRIKKMEDEGIILNYWTAINTFKLGYNVFRIYINFQYVNNDIKNKIIQHFVNYKKIWAVISLKAEIDFDVVVWVKDFHEFYLFWSKTLDLYQEYFSKYTISMIVEVYNYKKSYLIPEEIETQERQMYTTFSGGKTIDIDETDYCLLNELAIKARIPLIELSEKLNCSSQTINYRLKNLLSTGIINAFRTNINLQALNLQHYKLEIYLRNYSQRKQIWDYLKNQPFCDTLNVSIGWCDLEFEIIVENVSILSEIMDDINNRFPNVIKKQSFWIFEKIHKERWLPDLFNIDK